MKQFLDLVEGTGLAREMQFSRQDPKMLPKEYDQPGGPLAEQGRS